MNKVIGGISAILLFFGRGAVGAFYQRGIQYATDAYLRTIGVGIGIIVSLFILNYVFMVNLMFSFQVGLGLIAPVIGILYAFMPAIATPVVGVITADQASAPGDQENIPMVVEALKRYGQFVGLFIGWMSVYVFVTMVTPVYLSPTFFWLGHFPIVIILAFVAAKKSQVSPHLYRIIEGVSICVLIGILALLFVFQENIEQVNRMARTRKAIAEKYAERSNAIDKAQEAQIANIHVTKDGRYVIIVDGKPQDASAVIAGAKNVIESEGVVSKLTASAPSLTEPKSWIPWVLGLGTVLVLLFVFRNRLGSGGTAVTSTAPTVVTKTKTSTSSSRSWGIPWFWIILIGAMVGGYVYVDGVRNFVDDFLIATRIKNPHAQVVDAPLLPRVHE